MSQDSSSGNVPIDMRIKDGRLSLWSTDHLWNGGHEINCVMLLCQYRIKSLRIVANTLFQSLPFKAFLKGKEEPGGNLDTAFWRRSRIWLMMIFNNDQTVALKDYSWPLLFPLDGKVQVRLARCTHRS